jgi:hypothetical protein
VDSKSDQQCRYRAHDKCSELHVSLRVTETKPKSAENPENMRAK